MLTKKQRLENKKISRQKYYYKNCSKIKAKSKQWKRQNPEKVKISNKKCRLKKPLHYKRLNRDHILRYKYGITLKDFELLKAIQKSKCAICKTFFKLTPCTDHCHKTKKVRGLLCNSCNKLLGQSNDSIKILKSAIKYLMKGGNNGY